MGQDMESKACEGQGITVTEERLLAAHQMLGPRLHTLACRILDRHSPDVGSTERHSQSMAEAGYLAQ